MMFDFKIEIPEAIKIAAIFTATPRWVTALLIADGLEVPPEWETVWRIISIVFAGAMSIVEGLSFSYVFQRWRDTRGKKADRLLALAIISAITFVVVLTPTIAMQAKKTGITEVLGDGLFLMLWSAAAAFTTILIVMSVGYAQEKAPDEPKPKPQKKQKELTLKDKVAQCSGPTDFVKLALEYPKLIEVDPDALATTIGKSRKTAERWIARAARKIEQESSKQKPEVKSDAT